MPPLKKTGISSWMDRQLESAESAVGGRIDKYYLDKKKAEAQENAFDSPTIRVYQKMLGTRGVRENSGNWEAMIGGRWRKVPSPKPYFQGKNQEFLDWYRGLNRKYNLGLSDDPDDPRHKYNYRAAHKYPKEVEKALAETGHWPSRFKDDDHPNLIVDGVNTKTGERPMPEDKKKSPGAAKSGSAGEKNAKGGPKYAEDDFPIQGMNPTSGPLGGGPAEAPPPPGMEAPGQSSGSPGMPPGGGDPLSGAKWAEPILKAIPGNRGDLMNKAMKLIGQLGEILTEAGYVEGGSGGAIPGPAEPPQPGMGGQEKPPPASPPSPGMMQ